MVSALKTCARAAAILAILIGGSGLAGGIFGIPVYQSVPSGPATMKTNATLAFLLAGVSLWLRGDPASLRKRRIADACALVIALIGALTLLEYALSRDFGIDRLLFSGATDLPGALYPGRMPPITAALFLAVALGLLFLDAKETQGRRPAQFLLLLVSLFSLATLLGFLFGVIAPGRDVSHSSVLLPTALMSLLLSLGALCARPEHGIVRVVAAEAVGGEVARRLLPAAMVVPPLLCILSYLGYHLRWYDVGFGLALLTTLNSAVLTTLIWRTAGTLNRTEEQRRHAEAERNELNAALHHRVSELETLLDVLPIAVGIAEDPQCRRIRANPAFARMLAMPPNANISKSAPEGEAPTSFKVCRHGRELAPEELPIQIAAAQGVEVRDFDEEIVWNDGTTLHLLGYAAPLRDEQGAVRGSVGAFIDITERARLEEQLFQARKLESVGRLAGGVAHDFNNLLTAILGYAELADLKLEESHAVKSDLEQICLAADRAAALTSQLLAFARRQVIEPKTVNLNELILNMQTILQRLIGEYIELVMQPTPDLYPVRIDPNQLEQILVNLVVNARDAIPLEGGRITVETGNVTLDADYVRQHEEVMPGEYVMLAVSDTGTGMEEGIRLHIFEPFFTTKEKGRGTGLGLATVYGIVKQAGGHIWLYSEVGTGTTFKIYLPRATSMVEPVSAPSAPIPSPCGTETLLVVEDETSVRALTASALKVLGYHVLEAPGGAEALRIAQAHTGDIALLITDVVMPQMSGKELAERLLAARPALKVLYVSGYTENTIVHHGVLEPGIAFLPKPFTPSTLSHKVREVLDSL
jgi:two-component system, cell cycle sensor histidine kinase and response regulator CckA